MSEELKAEQAQEPMINGVKVSELVEKYGQEVEIVFNLAVEAHQVAEKLKTEHLTAKIELEGYLKKLRSYVPENDGYDGYQS